MNCKKIQIGLIVIILLLLWVNFLTISTYFYKKQPVTNLTEEILHRNRELEAAFMANDMMRIASFYSDNCVLIGENFLVKGKKNIDAYWINLKDRGVSWNLENIKIDICNNLAVQQGISKLVYSIQGQEYQSIVRFTLVWKRVNDNWLIEVDHYSAI